MRFLLPGWIIQFLIAMGWLSKPDFALRVVAESPEAAQDAGELVEIRYRDLPAAVAPEEALASGAPQLHENVPGNLALESEVGDAAAVEAAFARAAHVTRLKVEVTRVAPNPMEPRAYIAS